MKLISTGQPSNLKTYREIAYIMSGFTEDSDIVRFVDNKIKESPNGELEEVIADERQVLYLFGQMLNQELKREKKGGAE